MVEWGVEVAIALWYLGVVLRRILILILILMLLLALPAKKKRVFGGDASVSKREALVWGMMRGSIYRLWLAAEAGAAGKRKKSNYDDLLFVTRVVSECECE